MAPTFSVRNAQPHGSKNRVLSHQPSPPYHERRLLNLQILAKQRKNLNSSLFVNALQGDYQVPIEELYRRLIILDWDDTINPSSWCMKNGILTVRPPTRNDLQVTRDLSQKAAKMLTICLAHGQVVIVTNAESGWVELSARSLMPDVARYVLNESYSDLLLSGFYIRFQ